MANEQIHNSPIDGINQQIQAYVASNGQQSGQSLMLLTTRGRKSGLLRRTPVAYTRDGDNYVIIASNAGKDQHPNWYHNLLDNPDVQVQVGADKFEATAHVAEGAEKDRLWAHMTSLMPGFKDYQVGTERQIPVVVLTRK
ncbi:MAG TPA: nitroreductase family deazaflavin-dependent oxidoreductase [Phototrophicaceae bacterium]|nr:nitroreductase family deazaflavin-dependent oxidoreductase [Phototrophicaceae bacterium]